MQPRSSRPAREPARPSARPWPCRPNRGLRRAALTANGVPAQAAFAAAMPSSFQVPCLPRPSMRWTKPSVAAATCPAPSLALDRIVNECCPDPTRHRTRAESLHHCAVRANRLSRATFSIKTKIRRAVTVAALLQHLADDLHHVGRQRFALGDLA